MKEAKLRDLKDRQRLKRNSRSDVWWTVTRHEKGGTEITSENSGKTIKLVGKTVVYID